MSADPATTTTSGLPATAAAPSPAPNGAESEVLLGVTLVGPRAGDLIGQATLAIEMGATLTDLTEILFAHPGLGEMLLEGAESALGKAIHILAAAPAKASR